ncbi:MAG: hypothetical protein SGJ11_06155 [Phycisphaerae bacterium]|nr:hypothetical protein [Phycisphaerae bacterium]
MVESAERSEAARASRGSDQAKRWSGLPVAASLALVAFAVIFGVYGHRVVDRGSPSLGTTTWELADEVVEQFELAVVKHREAEPILLVEATSEAQRHLRENVQLPDLSATGFQPIAVESVTLPAATRSVLALYAARKEGFTEFVTVTIVPDREQYVVFSRFGRQIFLPVREPYPVETTPGRESDPHATVWSDGKFVFVVLGSSAPAALDIAYRLLANGESGSDAGTAGPP